MLATMMRDLLARSRAGKAGSCVPIPQARDIFFFSSHDIRAHHLPFLTTAVLALLHILVLEPRPRQGELSLPLSLSSPLPRQHFVSRSVFIEFQHFFPAPQNVPTSSGGPRMHRQGAKARGDQGARCILFPVPCVGQRQQQELAVPPLPSCSAVRGRTFAAA